MSSQSILIIDDSKLINNSLKASLQERGFRVTQAFDIASAKAILLENSFDYALLDLVLPDGDGEALLPFLQIHEEIRVIVMTSDRDADRRENLFSFGVVIDYITKERHFDEMELSIVQLIQRISTNKNLTVLIVDDSNFMRTHLRILLSKRGFKVLSAIDGKEALEIMKIHKIDAALIDLEMPVMDGNRLLGAIRRNKANLLMPVMAISGTSDPAKIARVIKNGVNDFLKKPYSNEELLLKVDKMMEELKQRRLIKTHEAQFAMYNRAIDEAAIFLKLDKNFNISYVNKALSDLITNDAEIETGLTFESCIHKGQEKQLEALKHALQQGKSYQNVFKLNSKVLQTLHLRLSFTALKESDDSIHEILVIGFDVTLLQQKESVLQERVNIETQKNWEQNKILIQQSKMASMGEMIGHIGHQWRQPLNTLGLIFQKINKAYHKDRLDDELINSSTDKAMNIISQMSKTINDFRDFFSDTKTLNLCKTSDIIEQTCDIILPSLRAKSITLDIDYDNNPSLYCLNNELSQVILNIIVNAMDALVHNTIQGPLIYISVKEQDDNVIITIKDNAGGIEEEIIEKIFEPYFTTKEKDNGTGIGLYMSKTIIQEHMKGTLDVHNTHSGAVFTISLPMNIKEKS